MKLYFFLKIANVGITQKVFMHIFKRRLDKFIQIVVAVSWIARSMWLDAFDRNYFRFLSTNRNETLPTSLTMDTGRGLPTLRFEFKWSFLNVIRSKF